MSVEAQVSAEEWQVRIDLAACYRIIAMYGWDDLVFTHISARVPGGEEHFLINPYGMLFEEIDEHALDAVLVKILVATIGDDVAQQRGAIDARPLVTNQQAAEIRLARDGAQAAQGVRVKRLAGCRVGIGSQ